MTRWLILLLLVVAVLRLLRGRRMRPAALDGAPWDPHAVLGVSRGVSRQDLAHAYRERLKEYHPDRVADLGRELQELAHRKTLDIQRAYAELSQS